MTATADNDQSRVRSLHEKGDCHRRCKSTVGTLATAFARRCPFRNPQFFRRTIDVLRAGVLLGMRHVDKPGCRWMRLYQSCLRLLNVMWAIQDKKACDRNQRRYGSIKLAVVSGLPALAITAPPAPTSCFVHVLPWLTRTVPDCALISVSRPVRWQPYSPWKAGGPGTSGWFRVWCGKTQKITENSDEKAWN